MRLGRKRGEVSQKYVKDPVGAYHSVSKKAKLCKNLSHYVLLWHNLGIFCPTENERNVINTVPSAYTNSDSAIPNGSTAYDREGDEVLKLETRPHTACATCYVSRPASLLGAPLPLPLQARFTPSGP